MRGLATAMKSPPLGTLPSCRFFEPTQAFVEAMMPFKGLQIFDAGSGVGHVTQLLRTFGFDVVPLDIYDRESVVVTPVFANACTFDYPQGSAVLLCRPCHGSFPGWVLEQAEWCKCSFFIYVGKGGSIEDDLGCDFLDRSVTVTHDVGEEGELMAALDLREI